MKKRILTAVVFIVMAALTLSGCSGMSGTSMDRASTRAIGNTLSANQPTPTDIEYSLERYNLIKRAYWVNGQKEKAMAVECPIERPLSYVVLMTESGAVVGRYVVDGKVTSLNSYLTPDSEYYSAGNYSSAWLPDVDGSYGSNDVGVFFFTPDGHYYEWDSHYLYTDEPVEVSDPIVTISGK